MAEDSRVTMASIVACERKKHGSKLRFFYHGRQVSSGEFIRKQGRDLMWHKVLSATAQKQSNQ